MLNKIMQNNIKMFTSQVEEYKKYYLRKDEEYIIKKYFKGKRLLVLGCGAGRTLIPLHQMGYQVTGIDITPKMIQAARQKIRTLPVKVYQMDACDLKFPQNSFDIVFFPLNSIGCIYPDIYQSILEARRVMKPNGVFVFSTHNRFCLKALPRFFKGSYANYYGIYLYRTTPADWLKIKKLFKKVDIIPLNSIATNGDQATWKQKIYKLLPFFDESTYFVCTGSKGDALRG